MRKKFVAGNWKMNLTRQTATDLASAVVRGMAAREDVRVALCPAFPYLAIVAPLLNQSRIELGAQNLYPKEKGAFTGEVSASMLLDLDCKHVILGHSERRHVLGESDSFINEKVQFALQAGLHVILCLGEKLDERKANQTEKIVDRQLTQGLAGVSAELLQKVVIAYEPVWAIGTGVNATPEQAQAAHAFIRRRVGELYSVAAAQVLIVQYGGSVNPKNAKELMSQPDVDGALVGGASLKADEFLAIIEAAR